MLSGNDRGGDRQDDQRQARGARQAGSDEDLAAGVTVGEYVIESKLGEGRLRRGLSGQRIR